MKSISDEEEDYLYYRFDNYTTVYTAHRLSTYIASPGDYFIMTTDWEVVLTLTPEQFTNKFSQ